MIHAIAIVIAESPPARTIEQTTALSPTHDPNFGMKSAPVAFGLKKRAIPTTIKQTPSPRSAHETVTVSQRPASHLLPRPTASCSRQH